MLGTIIFMIIIGLISGFIARALVPGNDSMSVAGTILLGMIGSVIGGFIGYLLFKKDGDDGFFQISGIIGSIVGSIIALLVYRAMNGRSAVRR